MSEKFNDWTKISSKMGVSYIEKDVDDAVEFFEILYGFNVGDSECPCCGHGRTTSVEKIDFDVMRREHSENLKIGKKSCVMLGVKVDEYFEKWGVK